jgi:hypothetical protein
MIICFLKAQAEIWLEQVTWECDMSFKRVRDNNIRELLFAKFLPAHNKSKLVSYL